MARLRARYRRTSDTRGSTLWSVCVSNFSASATFLWVMDRLRAVRTSRTCSSYRGAVLCLVVLVAGAIGYAAGAADASAHRPRVLTLRPKWRLVGYVSAALSDQRYVFMSSPEPSSSGRVLDEKTGKSRRVSLPTDCGPSMLGGGWLLFQCGPAASVKLFQVATGRWRSLQLPRPARLWDIGAHWLKMNTGQPPNPWRFVNVDTGQERTLGQWRPGGSVIPDLNSAGLVKRLCRPLRVPKAFDYASSSYGPGDMTFFGSFVRAQGGTQWVLERCGTRLHDALSGEPIGNRYALADSSVYGGNPTGVFLPSRDRFTIDVQAFLSTTDFSTWNSNTEEYSLFFTARRLYLLAPTGSYCGNHPETPCPPTPTRLYFAPSPKQTRSH
jgi:hypothetical protein